MDVEGHAVLGSWTSPGVRTGQVVYNQNRDDYEVDWCGRGGGRSEVWLHSRVLWMRKAGCEVLVEHGAGSGEHEDKQSRHYRAPTVGFATARP